MFYFTFLLDHKILVMARLCNLPSILTLTAGKVQHAPGLCVYIYIYISIKKYLLMLLHTKKYC